MNIEQELSRLSIGLISEPKVAVTRDFLKQILAHIQKQGARIEALEAESAVPAEGILPIFQNHENRNDPSHRLNAAFAINARKTGSFEAPEMRGAQS